MSTLRVAAVCCYTPLDQLHAEPFLVDTRAQCATVEAWAAENDGAVVKQWVTNTLPTRLAARWLPGVDVAVAPSAEVLGRAVADVEAYRAVLASAGVKLVVADAAGPAYTAEMLGNVHRRHSMPTSGYDGR